MKHKGEPSFKEQRKPSTAKRFECKVCGTKVSTKKTLERHMKRHPEAERFMEGDVSEDERG